jgi:hypothetical protein
MTENNVDPTPRTPGESSGTSLPRQSVRPATPDLILFNEQNFPIEFITDLLFEEIGGIEILSVTRGDIVNGQNLSYNIISNSAQLAKVYSSNTFIRIPGNINELFENFPIRFAVHVPDVGTAPSKFYVGEENSFGCTGFPVLNKRTDDVLACFDTLREAESFAAAQQNFSIVYVEEGTGNVVVDIANIKKTNRVEIEVLSEGIVEDDTIY